MDQHTQSSPPEILFGIVFGLLFAAFLLYLVSFLSGWHALGRRFRLTGKAPGTATLASATFRYIFAYRNIILGNSDAEALYLRMWLRLGHVPLRIPWSEITVEPSSGISIFKKQVMFLGTQEHIRVSFYARAAERLLQPRTAAPPPAPYAIGADGPMHR